MELVDKIVTQTRKAAADFLFDSGVRALSLEQERRIKDALKVALVDGYDELVRDMKDADDARMGASMLSAVFNAGCAAMAVAALQSAGLLPAAAEARA